MQALLESARRLCEVSQVTRQRARDRVLHSRQLSLDLQAGVRRLRNIQDKLIARDILPNSSGPDRAA